MNGGQALVQQLCALDVASVFCVPGESFLPVLDALVDVTDKIITISCRHESGAGFAAEAQGKLSREPGVAFVTRGPGAFNISLSLHVAQQDSTPMVVFVGQVASDDLGREAFQEVDYQRVFGGFVKTVLEPLEADDIPAATAQAFATASAGRPGPVVVVLREDLLSAHCASTIMAPEIKADAPQPVPGSYVQALGDRLSQAQAPLLIVGSNKWSDEECARLRELAVSYDIPVVSAFRRQDIIANTSSSFAGYLGLNTPDDLWSRVEAADLIISIGTRLDQQTARAYRLFETAQDREKLVQFYDADTPPRADASACRASVSSALDAVQTALEAADSRWTEQSRSARAAYLDWSRSELRKPESGVDLRAVCVHLDERMADNAIVTIDAGNFTAWPQRFIRFDRPRRLLAPINGAMGYGIPAALGAAVLYPERSVVCLVGDGGALMTGNEIATGIQYGFKFVVIVVNNSIYGTIRLHQERRFPERVIGTDLNNPDFAAFARSFGAFAERVTHTSEFPQVFDAALACQKPALIELVTDPEYLLPNLSVSDIRQ